MVMLSWSVHLTILFPLGKLEQAVNQYFVCILSLVTDINPSWMNQWKGENDSRNYFMIELEAPGSAVRHASVVRHVIDCTMCPGRVGEWSKQGLYYLWF